MWGSRGTDLKSTDVFSGYLQSSGPRSSARSPINPDSFEWDHLGYSCAVGHLSAQIHRTGLQINTFKLCSWAKRYSFLLLIGQIAVLDGFIILCSLKWGQFEQYRWNALFFWKITLLQPFRAFKISFGHTFESNLIPEESAMEMNKDFMWWTCKTAINTFQHWIVCICHTFGEIEVLTSAVYQTAALFLAVTW